MNDFTDDKKKIRKSGTYINELNHEFTIGEQPKENENGHVIAGMDEESQFIIAISYRGPTMDYSKKCSHEDSRAGKSEQAI
jgi:hypothetical protein